MSRAPVVSAASLPMADSGGVGGFGCVGGTSCPLVQSLELIDERHFHLERRTRGRVAEADGARLEEEAALGAHGGKGRRAHASGSIPNPQQRAVEQRHAAPAPPTRR